MGFGATLPNHIPACRSELNIRICLPNVFRIEEGIEEIPTVEKKTKVLSNAF